MRPRSMIERVFFETVQKNISILNILFLKRMVTAHLISTHLLPALYKQKTPVHYGTGVTLSQSRGTTQIHHPVQDDALCADNHRLPR